VFDEDVFVTLRVRRSRLIVVTYSASSGYFRDLFAEVFLVSGRLRSGLVSVGTCTAM